METDNDKHENYHNYKIIANLFTVSGANDGKLVRYSIDLNTIIVSNRAAEQPFFHHKYPISVNFARIGVELSKSLLKAVFLIGEQYKHEFYETHSLVNKTKTDFSLGDTSCLAKLTDPEIPQMAKDNLISDVTSGRFIAKSLKEFLHLIVTNQPIPDAQLPDAVTYDLFDLHTQKRQPGLRQYDEMQLFSLVYMQRFCSVSNGPGTKQCAGAVHILRQQRIGSNDTHPLVTTIVQQHIVNITHPYM